MNVQQLFDHFLTHAPWVVPNETPDMIESGDPGKEVRQIGIGWTACTHNLRAAAEDGCDLFITHEPSFCDYWEPALRFRETAWGRARTGILEQSGMALMALHDTWDQWPGVGIVDSWAECLGLSECPVLARADYHDTPSLLALYDVPQTTVDDFARHVAARVREFGEHGVFVMGDGAQVVTKVAVGAGCAIPEVQMLERGADVLVQVFDRAFQTFTRLPLLDLGANLIVVEHGASEMPGMRNMARYVNATFPSLEATFYRREPDSRVVTP